MIKLVNAQCPKCGAIMEVPEKLYYFSCIRCKSKVIVPKESGITGSPLGIFLTKNSGKSLEKFISIVGKDDTPLRILILHLLYSLSAKIPVVPDNNGLMPSLDVYLKQMAPINGEIPIGRAYNKE